MVIVRLAGTSIARPVASFNATLVSRNVGMKFHTGPKHATDLTDAQIRLQCKMYVAAVRLADDFGCDAIGIQYQQGLKDLLPASDLVEGTLNNVERPPVVHEQTGKELFPGEAIPHFNEVDECAGLDGLFTNRVHSALGQPVENTLHDLRWGAHDASGTTDDYVWVFLISGAAPPAPRPPAPAPPPPPCNSA